MALTAVLALSTAAFAGCGADKNTETAEGGNTLSYWCRLSADVATKYSSNNDNPMYQELEKRSGVKINFIHPSAGQEEAQFNMMMASRDLPDMIEYTWVDYPGGPQTAINDGVIIDLSDYIAEYCPNLSGLLADSPEHDRQSKTDEGNYYAFPAYNTGSYRAFGGLVARKDWLDELGLAVPETIDEWETVLRAFKEKKGAKSPFTGTFNDLTGVNTFNGAYKTSFKFYLKDGKVCYGPIEPQFKEYMTRLNSWYNEGLLDREIVTNNSELKDAKIISGEAGAFFGYGTGGRYLDATRDTNPAFDVTAAQYPVMNKGEEPSFLTMEWDAGSAQLAVTTECKNPEAAAKWADYLYSEEGGVLLHFGVEGLSYNMVDGYPTYTDLIMKNPEGLSSAVAMALYTRANYPCPGLNQDPRYLEQSYKYQQQRDGLKLYSTYVENARSTLFPEVSLSAEESEEYVNIMADIDTYNSEIFAKFITGAEALDGFDKYVEEIKNMGIERAIEINQQAYERYLAR